MFNTSLVTCMTGWCDIEFETKIISLAILKNSYIVIFKYFIIVLVNNNYCYYYHKWATTVLYKCLSLKLCTCAVNLVIHKWTSPVLHIQQYG
jgi:hypothetical protein